MIYLLYGVLAVIGWVFINSILAGIYVKRQWRLNPWERNASFNRLEQHEIDNWAFDYKVFLWLGLILFIVKVVFWVGWLIGWPFRRGINSFRVVSQFTTRVVPKRYFYDE